MASGFQLIPQINHCLQMKGDRKFSFQIPLGQINKLASTHLVTLVLDEIKISQGDSFASQENLRIAYGVRCFPERPVFPNSCA